MKCLSCGNEIPNVSTVCPFCGTAIESVQNGNSSEQGSSPQMKSLEQTQVLEPTQNESLETTMVLDQVVLDTSSAVEKSEEGLAEELALENPQIPAEEEPILYQTPTEATTFPEDLVIDANPLNQPDLGNGEKIANVAPPPMVQKKSKKNLFILIGIVIFIALMGVAFFLYTTLFKSATKRVDAIVDGVFKLANNSQRYEGKASGNVTFKTDIIVDKDSFKGTLEGKYAYDFKQKLVDLSVTLAEANYNDTSFIGTDPLKVQAYLYDKKAYILFLNFYENYIYDTIDNYDELFDSIFKEDVQYQVILNGMKNALKSGINAMTMKQTVEEKTIGSKTERVNVVSIVLNEANQKRFTNAFFNQLKNNAKFLEEYAKSSNQTVDEIKEDLDEAKEKIKYTNTNSQIEIYTSTFGTAFKGLKWFEGRESIELYPEGKNCIVDGNFEEANIHLLLTNSLKNTKTEKIQNLKIEFEVNTLKESHTIKGTVEMEDKADREPKVEKVNTKNSVEASHIPEADQQRILNNIMEYGNFKSLFGSLIVPGQSFPQVTIPENEIGL